MSYVLDAETLNKKCYQSHTVEDVEVAIEGRYHLQLLHK